MSKHHTVSESNQPVYDIVFALENTNENAKEVSHRSVSIASGTGLSEKENIEPNMKISPNPSNGEFYIELSDAFVNGRIKVYNPTGNLVWQGLVHKKRTSINIDVLSNGLYLITAENNKVLICRQLIIRN